MIFKTSGKGKVDFLGPIGVRIIVKCEGKGLARSIRGFQRARLVFRRQAAGDPPYAVSFGQLVFLDDLLQCRKQLFIRLALQAGLRFQGKAILHFKCIPAALCSLLPFANQEEGCFKADDFLGLDRFRRIMVGMIDDPAGGRLLGLAAKSQTSQ